MKLLLLTMFLFTFAPVNVQRITERVANIRKKGVTNKLKRRENEEDLSGSGAGRQDGRDFELHVILEQREERAKVFGHHDEASSARDIC